MVTQFKYISLLRRRGNARNVSYTPYPTGEKHTISTFVDQNSNPYSAYSPTQKKQFFSKLVFKYILLDWL